MLETPTVEVEPRSINGGKKGGVGVSLIIPMYNAEPFIEESLNSVLVQTFDDYEVLIVDDCSTDNSVEIVERIAGKFAGRLRLVRLKKNSGRPALPRNTAIKLARGKYVAFLDNDDILVPTAFEELYALAEKYNADVLRTDRYYVYKKDTTIEKMPVVKRTYAVDAPVPETNDIAKRLRRFMSGNFAGHPPWKLFLRRDFLIENNIEFPNMQLLDDNFFAMFCHVSAKKFILIPNIFYIYRVRGNSVSHERTQFDKMFFYYINDMLEGLRKADEFMSNQEVFKANPALKIQVINYIFGRRRQSYSKIWQLPTADLEGRYDYFFETLSKLLRNIDQTSMARIVAYLFCVSESLKTKNQQLTWQIRCNNFKTPKGAAITYFNTFLTVNEDASQLLHSNNPKNAIELIRSQKKFALYIPSMKKYIANFSDTGAINVQDDKLFLGETVENADGTISLRLNDGRRYISPRNNGRCISMQVNLTWEHITQN